MNRNQHLIPQALINRWESEKGIKFFSLEKNEVITEEASSKDIFGSKSINNKIDNKEIEDILNYSKIENDFNKLSASIIDNPKQRLTIDELNILCRYYEMFGLLASNYYFENSEIRDKLKEYINDISERKYAPDSYLIFTDPKNEFLLTHNAFRLKYGEVCICPISPEIIVCFGNGLDNSSQKISVDKNLIFNSDFCKNLGEKNDCNIDMHSYIVFRNNTEEYIWQCCQKPQYGQIKLFRVNQEQENDCQDQGQLQIKTGDNFSVLGGFGNKSFNDYHF